MGYFNAPTEQDATLLLNKLLGIGVIKKYEVIGGRFIVETVYAWPVPLRYIFTPGEAVAWCNGALSGIRRSDHEREGDFYWREGKPPEGTAPIPENKKRFASVIVKRSHDGYSIIDKGKQSHKTLNIPFCDKEQAQKIAACLNEVFAS